MKKPNEQDRICKYIQIQRIDALICITSMDNGVEIMCTGLEKHDYEEIRSHIIYCVAGACCVFGCKAGIGC